MNSVINVAEFDLQRVFIVVLALAFAGIALADVSHLGTFVQDDGYHYDKPVISFVSDKIL